MGYSYCEAQINSNQIEVKQNQRFTRIKLNVCMVVLVSNVAYGLE